MNAIGNQLAPCVKCISLFYRLLHYNFEQAKTVLGAPLPSIARFAEEQSPEQRDRIFDELNTLAVVYRQPSSAFATTAPAHEEVRNIQATHDAVSRIGPLLSSTRLLWRVSNSVCFCHQCSRSWR